MPDAPRDAAVEVKPLVRIGPSRGLRSLGLRELWDEREIVLFFAWRDLKARYKQTVLGAAWAIIQPVLPMAVFVLFLGRLAGLAAPGAPYSAFVLTALLPWILFARGVVDAGNSLVAYQHVIAKVYFPRLALPLAAVAVGLLDFAIATSALVALLAWHRIAPTPALAAAPAFVALAALAALAVGVWAAALAARYRDVRNVVPFLVQVGLYASPVVYSSEVVPERWRALYGLNPMAGAIEGLRWSVLRSSAFPAGLVLVSAATTVALLATGLVYFRSVERTIADTV